MYTVPNAAFEECTSSKSKAKSRIAVDINNYNTDREKLNEN